MTRVTNTLTATWRAILRGEAMGDDRPASHMVWLALTATFAAMAYGAVMGCYGIIHGGSVWQILFGAIKVPMLLLVTFALTLPSFLVVNTLLGLRADLPKVLYALLTTQTVVTIALLSLSPLTLFWYVSFADYQTAILFNGAMFGLASLGAQRPLRRQYAELIRRDREHGLMLKLWAIAYAFVGIQMGWVLRPFIGKPDAPVQFFRADKWDNAYVIVGRMIWDVLHR